MENIFELDFAQPQEQRLKQIRDFSGTSFFTKEAITSHCQVCKKELPLKSNRMTCSEKCRLQYAKEKSHEAYLHIKYKPQTPLNLIARKAFLKQSNKKKNHLKIDDAIRHRRKLAIKNFNKYFYGSLGMADAHFSEYLRGEMP